MNTIGHNMNWGTIVWSSPSFEIGVVNQVVCSVFTLLTTEQKEHPTIHNDCVSSTCINLWPLWDMILLWNINHARTLACLPALLARPHVTTMTPYTNAYCTSRMNSDKMRYDAAMASKWHINLNLNHHFRRDWHLREKWCHILLPLFNYFERKHAHARSHLSFKSMKCVETQSKYCGWCWSKVEMCGLLNIFILWQQCMQLAQTFVLPFKNKKNTRNMKHETWISCHFCFFFFIQIEHIKWTTKLHFPENLNLKFHGRQLHSYARHQPTWLSPA